MIFDIFKTLDDALRDSSSSPGRIPPAVQMIFPKDVHVHPIRIIAITSRESIEAICLS
jgi:hypothetical protein